MNTTFSLRVRRVDGRTAQGIAKECFDEIDLLESRLSRYVEASDISRINHLESGQTLYLSDSCHQCLLQALDAYSQTAGLFDVTLGTRIEHRKSGNESDEPLLKGRLKIHPDVAAVTCEEAGREIDLGGIGKGFALDQLKQLLTVWEVQDALLTAGASSMLAIGDSEWPVDLAGESESLRITLKNQSLSASGTFIQGDHIIHPAGHEAMPESPCTRIWVVASTAVLAEIWSTTLMLLSLDEILEFIEGIDVIHSVYAEQAGKLVTVR
ncbi:MAG: FAD:protein FMN transferase [Gloeobacteraceae cyanobacterium ES-bin-144]|nr:FAD:protein FMN transferase [Verrucomicrobiales bacterium]